MLHFDHDARARLVRLRNVAGGATLASYGYNGLGQRVFKQVGASVSHFLYDEQGKLLGEYDSAGNARIEFVWVEHYPVLALKAGRVFLITPDEHGTPRWVFDGEGDGTRLVWQWTDGEPFGSFAPVTYTDGAGQPFAMNLRLPGQYFDAESGMHYNTFRDYDPGTGRYIQADPIGLAGGTNLFAYAGHSPVLLTDPLGLFEVIRPRGHPSTFQEAVELGRLESVLRHHGDLMQRKIKRLCPSARKRLQPIFDRWRVYVDPSIGDPVRRARGSFATTFFDGQQTGFNYGFFYPAAGDPGSLFIFAHEFRHLMPSNNSLYNPLSIGERILGDAARQPGEIDADLWAERFLAEDCRCGQ